MHRSVLQQLTTLRQSLRILLLVDHPSQLPVLEASAPSTPWDVFIKLDVGSHRAGVIPASDALHTLVKAAEASPAVRIHGFYCHANHSYGGRTRKEAEDTLRIEWDSVIGAAKLLPADRKLVCSVGATPTAHVVEAFKADAPANIKLELHAGTYLLQNQNPRFEVVHSRLEQETSRVTTSSSSPRGSSRRATSPPGSWPTCAAFTPPATRRSSTRA